MPSAQTKSRNTKSTKTTDAGATQSPTQTPLTTDLKTQKPNKPEWQCELTKPPADPQVGYTVGEVFTLSCHGQELDLVEPLRVELSEEAQYGVVLLKKLELTKTKMSFEATSYRAAKIKYPYLHIVDGKGNGFVSQPLEITLGSVLPNPPPQQIYGGIGPFVMSWPIWLFFTLAVLFILGAGWTAIFLKRRFQRKSLEKNIRKFLSPLGSYHQFSKDIRKLRSGVLFSSRHEWSKAQTENYLNDLDEHFRMFLLREFIVPATTWSSRQILKEIRPKAKHSYHLFKDSLRKTLQELDRAKTSQEQLQSSDCDQLTKIAVKTVDTIWSYKSKGQTT